MRILFIMLFLATNSYAGVECYRVNGRRICEEKVIELRMDECIEGGKSFDECEDELIDRLMEYSRQKNDIVTANYWGK
jgi:hypothetical protein